MNLSKQRSWSPSPSEILKLGTSPTVMASDAQPAELQQNSTTKEGEFRRFESFDVASDCSDHHFFLYNCNGKNKNCFTNAGSDVYKNIIKEWKFLERHLPESIFVRVYENRIDLLRAVIIGAQGTPYHDGLFFFDIVFPFDYPNKPPLVYYHSHGLRLNPNLYSDGYVCLSLLNTWHGNGNERWNPNSSTIFQILVSLQGLVLNEKPYYNEPGSKPAWSWAIYNQDVFAMSCKTMLFLLRRPPKNFEAFVAAHFRERAYAILRACMAYRNGYASIGFFSDKGLSSKNQIKVSNSFKKSMDTIYPDLFTAFIRNGASLQNLQNDLYEEEKPRNVMKPQALCICHKLFWKIKLFLCFKKDDE